MCNSWCATTYGIGIPTGGVTCYSTARYRRDRRAAEGGVESLQRLPSGGARPRRRVYRGDASFAGAGRQRGATGAHAENVGGILRVGRGGDFARLRAQAVSSPVKKVRQMQGSIPQHVFHGTIYEAWPLVAAELVRAGMPAVLIGQNGTPEFSLAWPAPLTDKTAKPCDMPGGRKGRMVFGGHTITYPGAPPETRYEYKPVDPSCSPAGPPDRKTL